MEALVFKLVAGADAERAALIVLLAVVFVAAAAIRSLWRSNKSLEAELRSDHQLHMELLDRLLKPHMEDRHVKDQDLDHQPPGKKPRKTTGARRPRVGADKPAGGGGAGGGVAE